MSQKISGKNLHYDQTLPPFLARLRGQAAGNNDGPDPLLVRNRRHGKPRSASQEAEDGPVILDEEGNAVSGLSIGVDGTVTETEKKRSGDEADRKGTAAEDAEESRAAEAEKAKEKTASIGGGKKRKAAKVIGADEVDEQEPKERPILKKKQAKSKKIKLSFGDDEG